jgi:integrase
LGEAGADAFTIMRLMGHSTVTVSQRYVHPTPETQEDTFLRLQQASAEFELEQANKEFEKNAAEVTTKFTTVGNTPGVKIQ